MSKIEPEDMSKEIKKIRVKPYDDFDLIEMPQVNRDVYKAIRKHRRFNFTGGAIINIVGVNRPIKIYSILCYVAINTNTWWTSFDEPSGGGTIIDTNFLGSNFDMYATMIQAIQTQPAPITYKYFEGGFPVNNQMFFALRNIGAVLQAPASDYIEIDYEQLP